MFKFFEDFSETIEVVTKVCSLGVYLLEILDDLSHFRFKLRLWVSGYLRFSILLRD
jgi:hypothetical protein